MGGLGSAIGGLFGGGGFSDLLGLGSSLFGLSGGGGGRPPSPQQTNQQSYEDWIHGSTAGQVLQYPTTVGPYGSSRLTNPAYEAAIRESRLYAPMPGDYRIETTLSPEQQRLYNLSTGLSAQRLGDTQRFEAMGQPLNLERLQRERMLGGMEFPLQQTQLQNALSRERSLAPLSNQLSQQQYMQALGMGQSLYPYEMQRLGRTGQMEQALQNYQLGSQLPAAQQSLAAQNQLRNAYLPYAMQRIGAERGQLGMEQDLNRAYQNFLMTGQMPAAQQSLGRESQLGQALLPQMLRQIGQQGQLNQSLFPFYQQQLGAAGRGLTRSEQLADAQLQRTTQQLSQQGRLSDATLRSELDRLSRTGQIDAAQMPLIMRRLQQQGQLGEAATQTQLGAYQAENQLRGGTVQAELGRLAAYRQMTPALLQQELDRLKRSGMVEQTMTPKQLELSINRIKQQGAAEQGIAGLGAQARGLAGQALSSYGGVDAARKKAEDTAYASLTRRLNEDFTRQEASLRQQLANQGIMPGSAAYNRELTELRRTRSESEQEAARQAFQLGGTEATRRFGEIEGLSRMPGEFGSQLSSMMGQAGGGAPINLPGGSLQPFMGSQYERGFLPLMNLESPSMGGPARFGDIGGAGQMSQFQAPQFMGLPEMPNISMGQPNLPGLSQLGMPNIPGMQAPQMPAPYQSGIGVPGPFQNQYSRMMMFPGMIGGGEASASIPPILSGSVSGYGGAGTNPLANWQAQQGYQQQRTGNIQDILQSLPDILQSLPGIIQGISGMFGRGGSGGWPMGGG